MSKQFSIEWRDSGREPQCPANPAFPTGIDVSACDPGTAQTCKTDLPYPAKRCGLYLVRCKLCGYGIAITTAGRTDDPRSVQVPCKVAAGPDAHAD